MQGDVWFPNKCYATKQKQPKINATVNSPLKATDAPAEIDVQDVKLNLPTFELEELDDFNTIDDTLLAQLMTDQNDKENTNKNNNQQVTLPPPPQPQMQVKTTQNQQINNQINMPHNLDSRACSFLTQTSPLTTTLASKHLIRNTKVC